METKNTESGRGGMETSDEKSWKVAATIADFEDRDALQVTINDEVVAIYRVSEMFYATAGLCTHAHAQLCDGYVEGDVVECPLHAGRFHIPSGKAVGAPATEDLKVYSVRLSGEDILIRLS